MFSNQRFAFLGRLAGMPRRQAQRLVRRHGAVVVDEPDASVRVIVVGEAEMPPADSKGPIAGLAEPVRRLIDDGRIEVLTETDLWRRLGLLDSQDSDQVAGLYTPAMLADLLGVPIAVVRRWRRRGLIAPKRQVQRLDYYDFQEVATARRLADLVAAGLSQSAIEKQLAEIARFTGGGERPLAQLSIIVAGKDLLLRQGDGLIDSGGQWRFDFEAADAEERATEREAAVSADRPPPGTRRGSIRGPLPSVDEIVEMATECEDVGELASAADLYRTALAAGGPNAEIVFRLAELLYRLGDVPAARERYYMAIEIDEEFVEARANLGCVLAETGELEMAAAAFEGALAYHPDYPDVHYHLARALDDLGRPDEAARSWKRFLELAPNSPWAEEACGRLGQR